MVIKLILDSYEHDPRDGIYPIEKIGTFPADDNNWLLVDCLTMEAHSLLRSFGRVKD